MTRKIHTRKYRRFERRRAIMMGDFSRRPMAWFSNVDRQQQLKLNLWTSHLQKEPSDATKQKLKSHICLPSDLRFWVQVDLKYD